MNKLVLQTNKNVHVAEQLPTTLSSAPELDNLEPLDGPHSINSTSRSTSMYNKAVLLNTRQKICPAKWPSNGRRKGSVL